MPANLPLPTGHHLLIQPLAPKEQITGSGIVIPAEAQDVETYVQGVAQVLAIGPDAYIDKRFFIGEAWCKPGDWILIHPQTGRRVEVKANPGDDGFTLYKIINDQDVLAVVPIPTAIRAYAN